MCYVRAECTRFPWLLTCRNVGRNDKWFDYQAWLPLEFDRAGNISKLAWQDQWELQL